MLTLPKKTLYAIEAVVDIAQRPGDQPVPSRDVTERQHIPPRYLEPVLQQLVRAGVLVGVRGPRGGYRLAKERRRITLGEIIRVTGATEHPGDGTPECDPRGGSALAARVIRPIWGEVMSQLVEKVDTITVDDLCRRAREAGVNAARDAHLDFTI